MQRNKLNINCLYSKMSRICNEAGLICVVMICLSFKTSFEQMSTGITVNENSNIQNASGFKNNLSSRSFVEQRPTDSGINIGESFFLNRLRQGDSNALMRLGQLHQTVDTPMSLLHNFFQVFNQPDPRRPGFVSLLHNLAVARGLFPNTLAIGNDGLQTQHTVNTMSDTNTVTTDTQNANIVHPPRQFSGSVSNTNSQNNDSNFMHSNGTGQIGDLNSLVSRPTNHDIFSDNEISDSGEIIGPFGLRSQKRLQERVSSVPVKSSNTTTVTITNNVLPAKSVQSSVVHPRQENVDQINISLNNSVRKGITEMNRIQMEKAISGGTNLSEKSIKTTSLNGVSNVKSKDILSGRRSQVGGRFSSPSTRLHNRKFTQEGSKQRGAQLLSRNFVSQIRNGTVLNTLRQLILNRTTNQTQKPVFDSNKDPNPTSNIKRPSKLNFLLKMPRGVTLSDGLGTLRPKHISSRVNDRIINTISSRQMSGNIENVTTRKMKNGQRLRDNEVPQSTDNRKEVIMEMHDNGVRDTVIGGKTILQKSDGDILVDPFVLKEGKNLVLQRVGHIHLDPTSHILQLVGEMNLTLSQANYTIQRVGDLNIGQRRQFVMDVTVNVSSDEDKILLQRVGSTDIVPSERVQLHGTGDVRLLTKERVIIQRLGFVRFHTDPLKNEDKASTGTDEITSVIRIEPLTGDRSKPSLLFLGNETSFIQNEASNETVIQFVGDVLSDNETVIQFVGDVLSEIPLNQINSTHRPGADQDTANMTSVATSSQREQMATRNQSALSLVRERLNESLLPVLRESIVSKSKQNRISDNKPAAVRIHLNPIGRIFSTVEMKFE